MDIECASDVKAISNGSSFRNSFMVSVAVLGPKVIEMVTLVKCHNSCSFHGNIVTVGTV